MTDAPLKRVRRAECSFPQRLSVAAGLNQSFCPVQLGETRWPNSPNVGVVILLTLSREWCHLPSLSRCTTLMQPFDAGVWPWGCALWTLSEFSPNKVRQSSWGRKQLETNQQINPVICGRQELSVCLLKRTQEGHQRKCDVRQGNAGCLCGQLVVYLCGVCLHQLLLLIPSLVRLCLLACAVRA